MYDSRVAKERTGWRDEAISTRHREWGFDCPAVDIDWLAIDYDQGIPVALIDWKAIGAKNPNLNAVNYRVLRWVANKCFIPFLIVFYDSEKWCFHTIPANYYAKQEYENRWMSEREFVTSLYRLRGRTIPPELYQHLRNEK